MARILWLYNILPHTHTQGILCIQSSTDNHLRLFFLFCLLWIMLQGIWKWRNLKIIISLTIGYQRSWVVKAILRSKKNPQRKIVEIFLSISLGNELLDRAPKSEKQTNKQKTDGTSSNSESFSIAKGMNNMMKRQLMNWDKKLQITYQRVFKIFSTKYILSQ